MELGAQPSQILLLEKFNALISNKLWNTGLGYSYHVPLTISFYNEGPHTGKL